ncbi:MAG: LPS export ABC transporter permease LptF [Burkholderiaceae bacterium]|nr:LPS export ABC transporter permease LptF [Burkholderiaceae bacterium]
MLFHSSIKKELSRTFGATLVVLITVVMTMMLIRVLFLANRGRVNPTDVLLIMGYFVLGHLPTILTLCLFIAIVATLSRMYGDSEMVIWFTSGRGLSGLLRPLFSFSWPVCLVIGLLALFVWPWSNEQTQNMRTKFEQRSDLDRITPGTFQESANGNRVFFIDKETADANGKVLGRNNIFISAVSGGKESVTTARAGRLENQGGSQFLLLSSGQRSETDIKSGQTKVSEFEEYGNLVKSSKINPLDTTSVKTRSSWELLTKPIPAHLGELAWRIGLAFAAFNFVVLGIAIASGNPRVGRSGSFVFALFTFVLYYNLINLSQSWIASGNYPFASLLLIVHGGAFLLGALWLTKRHNNWSFISMLTSRSQHRRPKTMSFESAA